MPSLDIPFHLQQTFITNAPTYLDESRDPEQLALDLDSIEGFPHPALLTLGDQSPAMFPRGCHVRRFHWQEQNVSSA
jgi:hypothetical protein